LRVLVVDRGGGRAQSIPKTHNHAGFPDGIVGAELVANMARQARNFGARIECGNVTALRREADGFVATIGCAEHRVKAVLLATGVRNIAPPGMDPALHDQAVACNLLRYCPVCDGYEVTDADVGVIGTGTHAAREALFLRSFTARVTLIAPRAGHDLSAADRAMLEDARIALVDGPIIGYAIEQHRLLLATASARLAFEAVYPALGTTVHSDLAVALGAAVTASGSVEVDAHQRTIIAGLYAAGDVVLGLDQISHAMGQAGVAATAIRNELDARCALRR
jgi:thioredoxin reductase (NADPH)